MSLHMARGEKRVMSAGYGKEKVKHSSILRESTVTSKSVVFYHGF